MQVQTQFTFRMDDEICWILRLIGERILVFYKVYKGVNTTQSLCLSFSLLTTSTNHLSPSFSFSTSHSLFPLRHLLPTFSRPVNPSIPCCGSSLHGAEPSLSLQITFSCLTSSFQPDDGITATRQCSSINPALLGRGACFSAGQTGDRHLKSHV